MWMLYIYIHARGGETSPITARTIRRAEDDLYGLCNRKSRARGLSRLRICRSIARGYAAAAAAGIPCSEESER